MCSNLIVMSQGLGLLVKGLVILTLTFIVPCVAYVSQSQLFPYLGPSDAVMFSFGDGSYKEVSFIDKFQFLGKNYTNAYINGQGIITFGTATGSYSYNCNPNYTSIPTIAAYMTRTLQRDDLYKMKLLYQSKVTSSTALANAQRDVVAAFPSLEGKFSLRELLIVTWHNMAPFNTPSFSHLRNTFQAVLAKSLKYSFLLLYYNRIEWPTRASGRPPAQAGIFGGNANFVNTYPIPGSCNFSLVNIAGMSNIDQPGKFVFRVDTDIEIPQERDCLPVSTTPRMEPLQFKPAVVHVIGSVPLIVRGFDLCLNHNLTRVNCTFQDVNREKPLTGKGTWIPGQLGVICSTPNEFYSLGRVRVDLTLEFSGDKVVSSYGFVYVVNTLHSNDSNITANVTTGSNNNKILQMFFSWDRLHFYTVMQEISNFFQAKVSPDWRGTLSVVNISITELRGSRWRDIYYQTNLLNSGQFSYQDSGNLHRYLCTDFDNRDTPPRNVKFINSILMEGGDDITLEFVTKVEDTTTELGQLKESSFYDKKCQLWYDQDPAPPNDTLPCPHNIHQAVADWRFAWLDAIFLPTFSLPTNVFIQSAPSESGAASRCAYGDKGELVSGLPFESYLYRNSPNSRRTYWSYFLQDVIPLEQCCKWNTLSSYGCRKYFFPKRPPPDASSLYEFPVPFRVTGAGQVNTMDGTKYLLREMGFYWMFKCPSHLDIQVLLDSYCGLPTITSGTVITSVAFISHAGGDGGNLTKFQASTMPSGGLYLWMNDEPLNFYHDKMLDTYEYLKDNFTLYHDGVTLHINGTKEALFSFSIGVSIKVTAVVDHGFLNIVGLMSKTIMGKNITGLLGNFDGDSTNDFRLSSQPNNVTLDQLHKTFMDKWRVGQNESLFIFPPGKNYSRYYNSQSGNKLTANLQTVCQNEGECMLDYKLTSSESFALCSLETLREFNKLLNASEIVTSSTTCGPPPEIRNGGYIGQSFSLGSFVHPYCDAGLFMYTITEDKLGERLLADISFVCAASTQIADADAVWLDMNFYLPVLNYTINCMSKEEIEGQAVQSKVEGCDIPQVGELYGGRVLNGSFGEGFLLKVDNLFHVHGIKTNTTLICQKQSDSTFRWVLNNDTIVVKEECGNLVTILFSTTTGIILICFLSLSLYVWCTGKFSPSGQAASININLSELENY